jgi:hypothetical protein
MNTRRKLSRRSFLAAVAGSAVAGGGLIAARGEAGAFQTTDRDPTDPIGRGRGTSGGVTDRDPGDPIGRGRGTSGGSGGGNNQGTRTGVTDSDPTDPIGHGRGGGGSGGSAARSGCSDSDPSDPAGNGRNCRSGGGGGGGGEAYQTGRRERRYEVCWVDHPNRSNDECNMQTYSEWQTTWSDGRVEHDYSESQRRRAEMEARGYTARWHRMIVNEW